MFFRKLSEEEIKKIQDEHSRLSYGLGIPVGFQLDR